jgi:hypothetical protein
MGILGWAASVLLIFWVLGFFLRLGGALLNVVLILGIAMFILNFVFRGRGKNKEGGV